jgi:hypothetical protein
MLQRNQRRYHVKRAVARLELCPSVSVRSTLTISLLVNMEQILCQKISEYEHNMFFQKKH